MGLCFAGYVNSPAPCFIYRKEWGVTSIKYYDKEVDAFLSSVVDRNRHVSLLKCKALKDLKFIFKYKAF